MNNRRQINHRRDRRGRGSRRGSVMVEFSLAFVAFITVPLVMVELGRAIWTYSSLTHATFQEARFATVHGAENPVMESGTDRTAEAITVWVKQNAVGLMSGQVNVGTAYSPDNNPGSSFTATAPYPLDSIFGTFLLALGRPQRPRANLRRRPALTVAA